MGVVLKGGAFVPITLACKLNKANMLSEKIDIKRVYNSKISNSFIDIMPRLSGDPYHSFSLNIRIFIQCHCTVIVSLSFL